MTPRSSSWSLPAFTSPGLVARVSAASPAVVPVSASALAVAATRTASPAVAAAASKPSRPHESAPGLGGFFVPKIQLRVTGDGPGGQPFGCQPLGSQLPEAGRQLPMAERLIPELPMPVPVTRHPKRLSLSPCPRVTVPACPLAQARVTVPTCPLRDSVALTSPLSQSPRQSRPCRGHRGD